MRVQEPYQQHCSKTQRLTAFSSRAPADAEVTYTQRKGAASCGFLEQNSCIDSSLGTRQMLESGSKVLVSWRNHCWVHPHGDSARYLDSSLWCENKALPRKVTTGGRHAEQGIPSWAQHRWHCGTREKVYQHATLPSHLGGSRQFSKALKRIGCCRQKDSAYAKDSQNQWRRRLHLLHHENYVKYMYSIYCLNLINI